MDLSKRILAQSPNFIDHHHQIYSSYQPQQQQQHYRQLGSDSSTACIDFVPSNHHQIINHNIADQLITFNHTGNPARQSTTILHRPTPIRPNNHSQPSREIIPATCLEPSAMDTTESPLDLSRSSATLTRQHSVIQAPKSSKLLSSSPSSLSPSSALSKAPPPSPTISPSLPAPPSICVTSATPRPSSSFSSSLSSPTKISSSSSTSSSTSSDDQQPLLPICNNPSLNIRWIAEKFGAVVPGANRMSYPREFKLMVISYYHCNGQNKYRTCKEFQITKSMLNGWLQKLDKIKQSRPGSLKSGRSGRRPQFPTIEKQLFHLYSTHLCNGCKVGNRWIRETARQLARQQCTERELTGMCQFSERWLSNFKKRYRINLNRDWSSSSSSASSSSPSASSSTPPATTTTTSSAQSSSSSSSLASTSNPNSSVSPDDTGVTATGDHALANSDARIGPEDEFECLHISSPENQPTNGVGEHEHSSLLATTISAGDRAQIEQILNTPGRLPIHAFYERFPWLYRRNQAGTEPGRRGRKVQFPGVEKVLFERLKQQQLTGERISNRWLQQQARQLAQQICPEILQQATRSARCLFSEHWLHNFKKRYGVTLKPTTVVPATTKTTTGRNYHVTTATSQTDGATATPSTPALAANQLNNSLLEVKNWFHNESGQQQSPLTANTDAFSSNRRIW